MGVREDGTRWAAVVVNRDAAVWLDACLRALTGGDVPPDEIVVVDDGSSDDSLSELAAWPRVRVERLTEPEGFGAAARRGVAAIEAALVTVLVPEVELEPGFGRSLIARFSADRRAGALAPVVLDGRGGVLHAGGSLNRPLMDVSDRSNLTAAPMVSPVDVEVVTGGVVALRRAALEQVGKFDARYHHPRHALADLSLRLRHAGWSVRCDPGLRARCPAAASGPAGTWEHLGHADRVRFAARHLPAERWWREFVPAEVERVRASLRGDLDPDWVRRSGAGALEALARYTVTERALLDGAALRDAASSIRAAREELPGPEDSAPPRRLGRRRAHEPTSHQQAFNTALVRALESQDCFNRDIVAGLLLVLLDVIGGMDVGPPQTPGAGSRGAVEDLPPA